MLESNAFRTFMLIGSILILTLVVGGLLFAPMVEVTPAMRSAHRTVMGSDIGVNTRYQDHLTVFESLVFYIEGRSRGTVKHY